MKDAILNAKDRETVVVDVPEWGCQVILAALPYSDVAAWSDTKEDLNSMARLVALSIVDDNCDRVFSDADIPALAAKSWVVLNRLAGEALKLNGLTDEAADDIQGN